MAQVEKFHVDRVHYSQCKKKRGVIIDSKKIQNINTEVTNEEKATELIADSVTKFWIKEVLETDGDELKSLLFGKTYIKTKHGKSFSESDSWKVDGFRSPMKSKTFQSTSLIVVATIEGKNHDDYAITLCDKLPVFLAPEKYEVKSHSTHPARGNEASCVYMGFFMKGKDEPDSGGVHEKPGQLATQKPANYYYQSQPEKESLKDAAQEGNKIKLSQFRRNFQDDDLIRETFRNIFKNKYPDIELKEKKLTKAINRITVNTENVEVLRDTVEVIDTNYKYPCKSQTFLNDGHEEKKKKVNFTIEAGHEECKTETKGTQATTSGAASFMPFNAGVTFGQSVTVSKSTAKTQADCLSTSVSMDDEITLKPQMRTTVECKEEIREMRCNVEGIQLTFSRDAKFSKKLKLKLVNIFDCDAQGSKVTTEVKGVYTWKESTYRIVPDYSPIV